MTFITGRFLPRRTFLRGVGVTVALPFLDAFVPAGRPWSQVASAQSLDDPTRLVQDDDRFTNAFYKGI